MREISIREALNEALAEEMERDERVFLMGEEVCLYCDMTMSNRRLLAVDPGLKCSGWALFSVETGSLQGVGTISLPGTSLALEHRLELLQKAVNGLFCKLNVGVADLMICEGPAPVVLNPKTALKLEQVRCTFETLGRLRGVAVMGRVNTRTVQTQLLGLFGKQLSRKLVKEAARKTADRLFGLETIKLLNDSKRLSQDVIDAVLIGTFSISQIKLNVIVGEGLADGLVSSEYSFGARGRGRWSRRDLRRLSSHS